MLPREAQLQVILPRECLQNYVTLVSSEWIHRNPKDALLGSSVRSSDDRTSPIYPQGCFSGRPSWEVSTPWRSITRATKRVTYIHKVPYTFTWRPPCEALLGDSAWEALLAPQQQKKTRKRRRRADENDEDMEENEYILVNICPNFPVPMSSETHGCTCTQVKTQLNLFKSTLLK